MIPSAATSSSTLASPPDVPSPTPGPPAAPPRPPRASLPARLLAWPVRGYRAVRAGRPSPCRYLPTCSAYALDALADHGAWRGSWLTIRRLGRCHPWGGFGVDPVPPREA